MMKQFKSEISEGMIVRSADGDHLGKIIACGPTTFQIEKGFFFPKEFTVTYDHIIDVRHGEVILDRGKEPRGSSKAAVGAAAELKEKAEGAAQKAQSAVGQMSEKLRGAGGTRAAREQVIGQKIDEQADLRLPLVEEELIVTKHVHETGQVHIHKEIITEEKQITVPVTREVIKVERIPVTGARTATAAESLFEEESIIIPIHEEEVEIEKRPVIREELHVTREAHHEQKTARETVRRETAEIETEGDVDASDAKASQTQENQTQAKPKGKARG